MATGTKSPPKKKAPSKKPSKASSSRAAAPAKDAKKKKKARAGGSGDPGVATRVLKSAAGHIGDQSDDVLGLGLVLLGILSGLGMYAGAAGPFGDFLEAIFRGVLGVYGYIVPVLLVYFGVLVVVDKPRPEIGRIAVGLVLTFVAVIGGWHLIAGSPLPADGIKELWPAGGLVGWMIATPLVALLSIWGASAALLVTFCLGLLIVTKTPVSAVVAWLREAARGGSAGDEADAAERTHSSEGPATPASPSEADEATTRRRRAVASYRSAEQLPLEDDEDAGEAGDASATQAMKPTGQSAAAFEAGMPADPPAPEPVTVDRARVQYTEDGKRKAAKIKPVVDWDDYKLPPMDMLTKGKTLQKESKAHIQAQVQALQETFDQFGIDANVARWSRGPTVTRFEIELGPGVQVKKVANMGDDIAYALAAPDVRIVAPIPGKSAIGVEVPNRQRDLITLGDILRSDDARSEDHPLYVALGVDIAGNAALVNLATMPHLLVSGATGSGKSITLNAMITSIIMRARPDQVRMILIDPKRVELNAYEGAPHLLAPVVTDARRATDAVQWCVKEMEMRYETLARLGFRNIDGYNEAVAKGEVPADTEEERAHYRHMPYILLVIDELADLMLVAPRDVEDAICRIAQMARAVGIHMVIATQRPSVDVITGLIKANIPSRLALAVASQTDSRTILDTGGAEKLVGKGDMLFLPASQGKPSRLQGCFVTEREIVPVVEYCKRQREVDYVDGVLKEGKDAEVADLARSGDDDSDETLTRRAAEQVVNSGLGSTSMLQRKLRIGFARAGRIMDELEELGVVGPNEGSKAREVLWSPEELDNALEQGVF
ncbi:MAG: DNA translocase FtsK [Actinobacteria bacterium]|nr:DNA translocase FtsK [Actinomycetota bacterium]